MTASSSTTNPSLDRSARTNLRQLPLFQSIYSSSLNIYSSSQNILTRRRRICFSSSSTFTKICSGLVFIALIVTLACINYTIHNVTFKVCFGILLALMSIFQFYMAIKLIVHRANPLLELSQPLPISILVISSSIATVCCFAFIMPEYDISCAIRQPAILTCISLMGNVLVAKTWRISCLLSPTTLFAASTTSSSNQRSNGRDKVQWTRMKVMNVLTKLSLSTKNVLDTKCIQSCGKEKSTNRGRGRRGGKVTGGLRIQVTLTDLLRVTMVLMIPQIITQIINLSVPSIRMKSSTKSDEYGMTQQQQHYCTSDIGYWFLLPGILFAILPFVLALILNVKSSSNNHQSMPDVLREYKQILTSMKISVGAVSITLPSVAMITQSIPNAYAYLMAASVLSFILPLCYNIAWIKIVMIRKSSKGNKQGEKRKSSLDTINHTTSSNSSSHDTADGDSFEKLVAYEDAVTMSQMYMNMGNSKKALEVDADILSMFKDGGGDYFDEGGFTTHEIRSMGPKTLNCVVSALINNAKHFNSSTHGCKDEEERNGLIKKSTKSCMDALHIFQQAPARSKLKDRSVVFPGYSYMAVLIKSGDVAPPQDVSPSAFEQDVASRFVQETQFALFHHCRSLSMKAEFLAKNQSFEEALAVVEEIKLIYDASLHSKMIAEEYSLDHAGNIISLSALWLYHLDRPEEAMVVCNKVIDTILAEYNEKDLLNLTLLLLPIIKVLMETQGSLGAKRARELYNKHINEPGASTNGFFKPVMRPLMILLSCCSDEYNSVGGRSTQRYDDINDDIAWVLNGEEKINEWGDTVMIQTINWSPSCILSEACLYLAKFVSIGGGGEEKQRALLEEGIRIANVAEAKMKDSEGNVILPIAYSSHAKVFSELKNLSVPV